MATIKKAQKGMTMKQLKAKYPSADTTAKGDTRFEEFNAYAPKKFLKRVADTDKAFDTKYGKGKPAKDNKGGVVKAKSGKMLKKQAAVAIAMKAAGKKPKSMMKMGGKMSKISKKK